MPQTNARPATSPRPDEVITPNQFNLSGGGLRVLYSTSGFDGRPHFTYADGRRTLSFTGNQIDVTETPGLGTVVSVLTQPNFDLGSIHFNLLLPHVQMTPPYGPVRISTEGISRNDGLTFSLPHSRQLDSYTVIPLHGTASHVVF
ncbi:conserved protein of unknown function [Rhodovastum atsumiense]|uniref:Uncharacterized protein n=1 Tax=Rhodovastum atsumiense TaxID=504468 RepID=A0A5M6IYH1_9PROT|nr:hypothetical protein [Rhodovastum atsumiense]KAA5613396.1 hypothetical protein F1189_04870 [Rhodovastum atsumiense]CAH2603097.1 conserved protein of unknown function [Rhodovastum atsumiense]